ncbi:MAG: methylated-DNA--[protein]-cysteine S-methyltransferase [Thermodesulfobacterium sp.]|nr:methylated-DNA--[protein]-cysteine S-methyltransferase [Thermodesulfobacterium sp.]
MFPFKFHLFWNDSGELIRLNFEFSFDREAKIFNLTLPKLLDWVKIFYQSFLDYWNFKKSSVEVPHKILATDFQITVLKELKKLKIGEVLTYKELTERIGYKKAFRAVGNALSKNPLPLIYPCHRVISSKGLGRYSQGLLIKQFLLYREYKFLTNSVKNMTEKFTDET